MLPIGTYNQTLTVDVVRPAPIYGFRPFPGMLPKCLQNQNIVQVLIMFLGSPQWINIDRSDVNLYN